MKIFVMEEIHNKKRGHLVQQPVGWSSRAIVLGNFQYRDVLLAWPIVELLCLQQVQEGCLDNFVFAFHISFLSSAGVIEWCDGAG